MADCISIPGIKAIAWLRSDDLPRNIAMRAVAGAPLGEIDAQLTPVTFIGFPECQLSVQKIGAGFYESVSLKFDSLDILPIRENISLVVYDILGRRFLIGAREAPFPEFKSQCSFGKPGGDPAVISYEVSHVALRSMLEF